MTFEPMKAYFSSVNHAGQALHDLKESGFTVLGSNINNFNESIHPDNSGGTLSDMEFRFTVSFNEPTTQEQFDKAVEIVERHAGKI